MMKNQPWSETDMPPCPMCMYMRPNVKMSAKMHKGPTKIECPACGLKVSGDTLLDAYRSWCETSD